jgi:thiamine pyrophosphate-dependent acetolactate synthase large subunit-like protein
MAKRVARIIVETLQAFGVKHCWGVPGDTLNLVADSIRRSDQCLLAGRAGDRWELAADNRT